MARLIFLMLLAMGFLSAPAQSFKGHFLQFGLGGGHQIVKDEALSPVSYSGYLGQIHLGYTYQNQRWISDLHIAGLGGFQNADVGSEQDLRQTSTGLGRASYHLSRNIIRTKNFKMFAGILSYNSWDYRNHERYGNSQDNFAGLFSAGAQFTFQRLFKTKNSYIVLQYGLGVPVATYYMRPGFIKPYLNQKIANKDFAFWGDFYTIDSDAELIFLLQNGNQIRVGYQWDFSQLDVLNKTQAGLHQISVSTVFQF